MGWGCLCVQPGSRGRCLGDWFVTPSSSCPTPRGSAGSGPRGLGDVCEMGRLDLSCHGRVLPARKSASSLMRYVGYDSRAGFGPVPDGTVQARRGGGGVTNHRTVCPLTFPVRSPGSSRWSGGRAVSWWIIRERPGGDIPAAAATACCGWPASDSGGEGLVASPAGCVEGVGGCCEFLEVPLGHLSSNSNRNLARGNVFVSAPRLAGVRRPTIGCSPAGVWYQRWDVNTWALPDIWV